MIMWAAGISAVVCLVYYGIIVCYSGFSTSFAWFWLLIGIFLLILAAGLLYGKFHPKRYPLWVPVSMITCFSAFAVILCVVEVLVFLGAAGSDVPNLDYVIVLGAKVEEEHISNSLQKRLDKAIEYSQKNPEAVLVLSGGKGKDEPASEASIMYEYLKYNGVPEKQMVMEDKSTNTKENMVYSKMMIDRMEKEKDEKINHCSLRAPGPYLMAEDKPVQIGVLTSNFHVFRAIQIGKKCGIDEVHGISAKSDFVLFIHFCVRECAAILKDKLMGNM